MRLGSKVIYSEIYTSFRNYLWRQVERHCYTPKGRNEYEYFKTKKRLTPVLIDRGFELTNPSRINWGEIQSYCCIIIIEMIDYRGINDGGPVGPLMLGVEWSHREQVPDLSEPNENGFQVVKPNFFEKLFG